MYNGHHTLIYSARQDYPMTDKQQRVNKLLAKIKRERSIDAIEELYDLVSPAIKHIALKYLRDVSLAEELTQDFWADIYHIADKFLPFGSGQAYLCKIAKNKAINYSIKIRGERAHIVYVDYSEMQFINESENTETIMSINDAISKLSEIEQIIIQAVYFEEKTVREIAVELKISKSQVQRHKDKAIEKLKKELLSKEEILK